MQGYVYRLYQMTATGTSTIGATANITEDDSVTVNVTMPGATWYLEVSTVHAALDQRGRLHRWHLEVNTREDSVTVDMTMPGVTWNLEVRNLLPRRPYIEVNVNKEGFTHRRAHACGDVVPRRGRSTGVCCLVDVTRRWM